ncbi:MAG: sporulation protein [Clostridia bacterium]|nr:sporulation protein [Clostridia bacterium]
MSRKKHDGDTPTPRERFADAVGVSKEILLDTVLISCIGSREVTLENYKSILAYSDTAIRIQAKPRAVEIAGKRLELRCITKEMLYITGRIDRIGFLD